jgi:hypothetical protein
VLRALREFLDPETIRRTETFGIAAIPGKAVKRVSQALRPDISCYLDAIS